MNRLWVVVVLLMAASVPFALVASHSPVKFQPYVCSTGGGGSGRVPMSVCEPATLNTPGYAGVVSQFYSYQSYAEVAEGFVVISALCILVLVLRVPAFLKREVALPRPLALIAAWVTVAGLVVFGFVETCNILYAYSGSQFVLNVFYTVPDPLAPVAAMIGLLAATVSLGVLRVGKGFFEGIKSGLVLAASSMFVAQMGLLVFDFKEISMSLTHYVEGWSLVEVPILSNWLVLMVAGFLTIMGFYPTVVGLWKRKA